MANGTDFWTAYHHEDPGDGVAPPVLEQAVGATLAEGEAVACARFIVSSRGRIIGRADWGSHVAAVTDRRIIRVSAWTVNGYSRGLSEFAVDEAGLAWRAGATLETGYITRYSLWHGQTIGAELELDWPGRRRLTVATRERGRQIIVGRIEAATALHDALRAALAGPGALALPPSAPG